MVEWFDALVGLGIGILLGAAGTAALLLLRRAGLESREQNARIRAELQEQRSQELDRELAELRGNLEAAHARRETAERTAAALTEKVRAFEEAESRLKESFRAAGAEALAANSRQFVELASRTLETILAEARGDVEKRKQAIDGLVSPLKDLLEKHNAAVSEIEQKRVASYSRLDEQIKAIAGSHERLSAETGKLVTALRRPEQRGRWGEMQLRNAVELAGMTAHCDFTEQPQTDDPATRDRPDMTVHLPGEGVIVVDSKVALDAYLDALGAESDASASLRRHAEQVEEHFKKLSSKRYWEQFARTPKVVVMFMPLESALTAALESKPDLHAEAMRHHVLIATPTLLVALLRAAAYGWQQQDVAANARRISDVGRELYDRLSTFVDHLEQVGTALDRGAQAYNSAVGSLERMVLPSSRRLKELHATTAGKIEAPPPAEIETRRITASELKPAAITPAEAEAPATEKG
ncbi:MAG: DNA recombination protein RmuC [Planctomycetota bacterium]|jgi:DNA recombination protein RmuC